MFIDVVVGKVFDENIEVMLKVVSDVVDDDMIFDIGLDFLKVLEDIIKNVGIIVWNGFVGVFEFE